LSIGITAAAPGLGDLCLHLDYSVSSSPWPTSLALLLFLRLTARPQVRPTPRSALPSYGNAIFAAGHQEYRVYFQLVNIYAWRRLIPLVFKNAFWHEQSMKVLRMCKREISETHVPQQHILFAVLRRSFFLH
jgi:hypothetical protein